MCPPVILGLQVAATAAGVMAQQQAADAQTEANMRQYDATMRARAANLNQTNLAAVQEREASMQKLEENNLKAREATSAARVSSGESGISGLSVDALLADLGNKQNRYNSSVAANYDRSMGAIESQRQNVQASAESQINSLKTPQAPDYMGAALRIGTSAFDYDQKYNGGQWFGKY